MHLFRQKKDARSSSSKAGAPVDPHQAIARLREQGSQLTKRQDVMEHRANEVRDGWKVLQDPLRLIQTAAAFCTCVRVMLFLSLYSRGEEMIRKGRHNKPPSLTNSHTSTNNTLRIHL